MDTQHQDQTNHTNSSGNDSGHVVHLCHRCGWPFPNPHPSAKHRRSHKKICGTIEGYTNLIDSETVSDDEHHLHDEKDKTPIPKIEKKSGGRVSRSEEDLFADAVNEFSDSGVEDRSSHSSKTLDRDLFFSFKDAENGGNTEILDAPIEITKVDTNVRVSENVEKTVETEITNVCDSSEAKLELSDQDGKSSTDLAKEAESIIVEETRTSETKEHNVPESVTEEAKSLKVEASDDNVDQEKLETGTKDEITEEIEHEKLKSDCEIVSEVVIDEKSDLDHEHVPEVTKDSETDLKEVEGVSEVIKHEKIGLDHKDASEVVKEPEVDQSVSILSENEVLGAPEPEKCSSEQIQEVFKEPDTVLGAAESEKCSDKNTQEVVEEPKSVLIEKESDDLVTEKEDLDSEECSNKQTLEPDTVLIEKEDLGNKHTQEEVKKPDSVLTEKEDLGAPNLEKLDKERIPDAIETTSSEKCLTEVIKETKDDNDSEPVADVSVETITPKESEQSAKSVEIASDHSIDKVKIVEEGTGKPMTNQDSSVADLSVDSSSRNSLEGNWGSVSVLSTASIDAETVHSIDKSKGNIEKPVAADNPSDTSDVFEPPSFMTLVEPKGKDQKLSSAEGQQEPQPKSEAGWFPTLTNVSNESEGRKRNEEVIAKVTNWSTNTGKHSTPLKNLLGEAKSPNAKQAENVVEKDEGAAAVAMVTEKGSLAAEVNKEEELSSPPKLIEEGKKGKKVKGRASWMPFVCCSSVNVN